MSSRGTEDLPDPGIKPVSLICLLHWQMGSLALAPHGKLVEIVLL